MTAPLVLLADDDPEMRRLLSASLRRRGYRVTEVASGTELCERLLDSEGAEAPSVVVSDVRMPGLTGIAVLRAARQRGRSTPFVLITAWGDAALHAEVSALGATLLDKPFDVGDLSAAVAAAVGG